MGECPLCGKSCFNPSTRLIKDSCGHVKCRLCLLEEENGCKTCKEQSLNNSHEIQSIIHSLPEEIVVKNTNFSTIDITAEKLPNNRDYESLSSLSTLITDYKINENLHKEQNNLHGEQISKNKENAVGENEKFICNTTEQNEKKIANDENRKMVLEIDSNNPADLMNSNYRTITNDLIVEENNIQSQIENVYLEESNNEVTRSPDNCNKSYRSPEFILSDYLLFKNPHSQYNNLNDPKLKLSDCKVLTSDLTAADNKTKSVDVSEKEKLHSVESNNTNECDKLETSDVLNDLQNSSIIEKSFANYTTLETKKIIQCDKENDDETITLIITNEDDQTKEIYDLNKVYINENKENEKSDITTENNSNDDKENDINPVASQSKKKKIHVKKMPFTINTRNKSKTISNNTIKNKTQKTKCKNSKEGESTVDKKVTRKRKSILKNEKNDSKVTSKRKKPNKDWSHIEILNGDPVKYKCNRCQKIFTSFRCKVYHSACLLDEMPFKCEVCERTFTMRSHFEYHQKVHTGDKPFQCVICDKSFIQKHKLHRHMSDVHNREDFVECDYCQKKFKSKDYLKNHLSIHQPRNYFKCKFCPKTFSFGPNLKRHERSHSTDRPFKCEICSNSFKAKFLLTRHKRIHEKNRPFSCPHCQRVFLSKFEVQRHITVHSVEKPYLCKECNIKFRRKDNLKRHIKHHHTKDSFNQSVVPKDGVTNETNLNSTSNKIIDKVSNIEEKPKQKKISKLNKISSSSSNKSKKSHTTRETESETKNPITIKHFVDIGCNNGGIKLGLMEPIPLEEVININRKIEESLHFQGSCAFPGLTSTAESPKRKKSESCNSNSNSNDGIRNINKKTHERIKTAQSNEKEKNHEEICDLDVTINPHKHWRRKLTESLRFEDF